MVASEVEAETVWLVAKEQSKYWKSINIRSCELSEGLKSAHLCFQDSFPLLDFRELVFDVPDAPTASVFLLTSIKRLRGILKAHRQDYMYSTFGMLEVPLMHDDVREKFAAQVMCCKERVLERVSQILAPDLFVITVGEWSLESF